MNDSQLADMRQAAAQGSAVFVMVPRDDLISLLTAFDDSKRRLDAINNFVIGVNQLATKAPTSCDGA